MRPITVVEAALLTGRDAATVRKWIARGHLTPVGRGRRRKVLLDVDDVWAVERDTRRRATAGRPRQLRRTAGTAPSQPA